ncbi:hypothetical protein THAOC_28046, partial [Thalassiosira oceanica]
AIGIMGIPRPGQAISDHRKSQARFKLQADSGTKVGNSAACRGLVLDSLPSSFISQQILPSTRQLQFPSERLLTPTL